MTINRPLSPEMIKLRQALDERAIPWEDHSDPDDQYSKVGRDWEPMQRTRFAAKGYTVSVIYGQGSYGLESGLLEAYVPESNEDPDGWQTANDVIAKWCGGEE